MRIGGKIFEGRTYVMAIINVTPDSFWRDSRASAESALSAAMRAAEEGADILDVGAQSTRPGYAEVSADEELARRHIKGVPAARFGGYLLSACGGCRP